MASNELIVDDDYCRKMGNYFEKQGEQLDNYISTYISILENIENDAIMSGDTSNALSAYINQAKKMNKQIDSISKTAKAYAEKFISKIDEADEFLF